MCISCLHRKRDGQVTRGALNPFTYLIIMNKRGGNEQFTPYGLDFPRKEIGGNIDDVDAGGEMGMDGDGDGGIGIDVEIGNKDSMSAVLGFNVP